MTYQIADGKRAKAGSTTPNDATNGKNNLRYIRIRDIVINTMNKLNILLIVLIIYALGATSGLAVSKYIYGEDNIGRESTLAESYNLLAESKTGIQKQFLHFYMNEYCTVNNSRVININMTGIIWDGIYCDKDTVLILSDSFPPLPIAVLNVDENTGE
jgi:hypothetical protein